MRKHSRYPRAIGWVVALAAAGVLLPATALWASGDPSRTDAGTRYGVVDEPLEGVFDTPRSLASDVGTVPMPRVKYNRLVPSIGGDSWLEPEWPVTRRWGQTQSFILPRQGTYPDPCGQTINGTMGTCNGTNCITFLAAGRIYRDGVAATCENGKPCPGLYTTSTQHNDFYYFSVTDPDAECNCIEVQYDDGTCSVYVHLTTYAGVVPQWSMWACNDGATWDYIADQGSSMDVTFSGEFPAGGAYGSGSGDMTFAFTTNYYPTNMGCSYSANVVCRSSESMACALGPIETKIDNLEIGPGETKKGRLCHIPPGNPDNSHIIEVGWPAVDPHMRYHGDCMWGGPERHGPCQCPPVRVPVPAPAAPPAPGR
jgi:hypothetical protein